jgi:hypothetical protein
MATKLLKPVSRESNRIVGKRPIIVTLAPAGNENEALIGLRLKGTRTQYVCALSDVYRCAALWHGQKLANAKRQARKTGTPWRIAKHDFEHHNRIETYTPRQP